MLRNTSTARGGPARLLHAASAALDAVMAAAHAHTRETAFLRQMGW